MSSIHDRINRNKLNKNQFQDNLDADGLDHYIDDLPQIHETYKNFENVDSIPNIDGLNKVDKQDVIPNINDLNIEKNNRNELEKYLQRADDAMAVVDDVVTKQYLTKLDGLPIISVDGYNPEQLSFLESYSEENLFKNNEEEIRLFKVTRMVYEKDEFATDKFISAISAMSYADCSVFLILDGFKNHTDFYIGIKSNDNKRTTDSVEHTLKSSLEGQFPGIILQPESNPDESDINKKSPQTRLFEEINKATSVSSFVGIPSYKDEKEKYNNSNYVQGVEKLALAMQGRRYTAIIMAKNLTPEVIDNIRNRYEDLYTQLSAVSTQQLVYSTTESLANAISRSSGYNDNITNGSSKGITKSHGTTKSHSENENVSEKSGLAKAGSIVGGALMAAGGVALMATGVGAPIGAYLIPAGVLAAGGALSGAGASGKQKSKGTADTTGENESEAETIQKNFSVSHTEVFNETNGHTATIQSGKNFTLTLHNKHVEELQKRIEKQLERIDLCESTGLWSVASYFLSYENDVESAETGATIFKSIMQGEKSGIEASAINTWYGEQNKGDENLLNILKHNICCFEHPQFEYQKTEFSPSFPIENSSLINSKELAMLLSLPRKSVPGLPVIEHISLGMEVVRHGNKENSKPIELGCIFDQGVELDGTKGRPEIKVELDAKSLTQHIFVTGSTGSGKSETVYKLIEQAKQNGVKFLIIEPAKGEYKNVFGNDEKFVKLNGLDTENMITKNIFGTNPELSEILRINPFRFPERIHVLEHIDRLIEIFNVCWPMYAAMPAVLKKAIIKTYEKAGWDLVNNLNEYGRVFPTFKDLLIELENVINDSAYSEEVKGNYIGSLVMRIESLTNGLNGMIFDSNEIGDEILFDQNAIVDLSRIGSQETKALIMGILVMRLSEYRMVNSTGTNSDLKHITVLEEAHNILKRTSTEQSMEGSNVTGKAVEMITNSIAEMRTYGEGFIIVDQSPTSVDPAAIKNTNTKIIMRLPDGEDRKIAGKSAGMKDNQVDEIAKLPTGVGITYQNDWEEPVMCKVQMKESPNIPFFFEPSNRKKKEASHLNDIISFLLAGRNQKNIQFDIDVIEQSINSNEISTAQKIELSKLIKEFKDTHVLNIWEPDNYENLSRMVSEFIGINNKIRRISDKSKSFEELDEKLKKEVENSLGMISSELNLLVRHALMKNYSFEGETPLRIYKSWSDRLKI